MRRGCCCSVLLASIMVAASAIALEPNEEAATEEIRIDTSCPALFGTEDARSTNRRARREELISLESHENTISVVHSSDWTVPRQQGIRGMQLLSTGLDDRGAPYALLELSAEFDPFDCPAGVYRVRRGDTLGPDGQVVGILENLLLFSYQEELCYFTTADTPLPEWRMIWRAPWKIPMSYPRSGSYVAPPRPSPPARTTSRPTGRGR